MSIRIAGQVVASAGSLTAHNHDAEAHPEIRALIEQGGGGGGSAGSADVAEALRNQNEAEGATEHLYNWVGTLAEYEAQNIATEHPEWIVLITDDVDINEVKWGDVTGDINAQTDLTNLVHNAEIGIRADVNAADKELQAQIAAQASAIAEKQDKIAAGEGIIIEGNVISATGGGGGSAEIPDNVYTSDNLIAGKNVEIIDEPVKSDIDEDTMLAMHFDGDLVDNSPYSENFAMDSNIWGSSEVFAEFGEGKFGKCLTKLTEDTADNPPLFINPIFQTINDEFTVEYWQHITVGKNDSPAAVILLNNSLGKNVSLQVYYYKGIRAYLSVNNSDNNISSSLSGLTTGWHHFVLTGKTNQFLKVYADGELKHTETNEISDFQNGFTHIQFGHSLYYMDEVRISRKILYTGDTYEVPTKPYSKGEPTGRKAINNTLSKTSELENDSGFLTGLPDGVFSKDTLLGGKDIEIIPEPVEGGIDEHTLACWHFDGDKIDAKSGIEYSKGSITTSYIKFGSGALNGLNQSITLPFTYSSNADISFDCWMYVSSSGTGYAGFVQSGSYSPFMFFYRSASTLNPKIRSASDDYGYVSVTTGVFHHLYAHYIAKENKYEMFVDGKKIASEVIESAFSPKSNFLLYGYVDEVRISDCVRWTEDFTPPTEPYQLAEPTGNMVVNYTGESLQKGADYVVESYNDGANWYRVYKSGWVEQGGHYSNNVNNSSTFNITLLKEMGTTIFYSNCVGTTVSSVLTVTEHTTTTVQFYYSNNLNNIPASDFDWYVCGQGA